MNIKFEFKISAILLLIFFTSMSLQAESINRENIATAQQVPIVTTIAGRYYGFIDGTGENARFNYPQGISIDSIGNKYIVDTGNNAIRKINSQGLVSTFAGNGTTGYLDGQGKLAQFNSPRSLAVDSADNVYVADAGNYAIRKISPFGLVSTIMKSSKGFVDGPINIAKFETIQGIHVDKQDNIYIADSYNHAIRKISQLGVVSTIAGNGKKGFLNGQGMEVQFNFPGNIDIDIFGNIYVVDFGNNVIRKIDSLGVVSTVAGNGDVGFVDGQGANARFNQPYDLSLDKNGNIYVADAGNSSIRVISQNGIVSTIAGGYRSVVPGLGLTTNGFLDGTGVDAKFRFPNGVAVDANSYIYLTDNNNHAIRKIAPIEYLGGTFCSSSTMFNWYYPTNRQEAVQTNSPNCTPEILGKIESGVWWNPLEGGSGYAIEVSGNSISLSAFLYDSSGRATWYTSAGKLNIDGSYDGKMTEMYGGQSLGRPFQVALIKREVTDVQLKCLSSSSCTLIWSGGIVPIQRFIYGGTPIRSAPESGIWWNPSEGGRGYVIEVQSDVISFTAFLYDNNGNAIWYQSAGQLSPNGSYSGKLTEMSNGQSLGDGYKTPNIKGNALMFNLTCSTVNSCLVTWDGGVIPIEKYLF